ncbi:putative rhamnosyl transferase [Shimia abyssi]|uniref:Putative rhamnosyltransferase n=1 Tax=Shimia abyssi TaxID=1662395 RepID=A0A2P8EXS3_9RHOB|nr:putative rhamnosyl transferase [Shimia abyssi]PSL14266.1 putative rhamnosyltransferase [Shimia abyssi]
MNSRDMQVIGICRFSYPAIGGFQVDHGSAEDRMAYLYDPARMEQRFRSFETFTLPPLRAQTDPDFTFLVVIGNAMPPKYLDRLHSLLADIPQAVVQKHAPGPHRQVMKQAINSVRKQSKAPTLQFRMDDDDAVGVRYVERLREAAYDLSSLMFKHRHIAIDFNQGFIASPHRNGIHAKPTVEHLWTAALAMCVRPGVDITIMNFGHSKLARFMPVTSFTGEDMFIRGHSELNDSRQKKNVRPVKLNLITKDVEDHLRRVYNIDADQVRSSFA